MEGEKVKALLLLAALLLASCSTVGNFGVVMKGSADPGERFRTANSYEDLGPVEGKACRYFLLGIIPFGDSNLTEATDKALASADGDAIINASVSTSLYGFIPIYNILGSTCTTVKGTAIKFPER